MYCWAARFVGTDITRFAVRNTDPDTNTAGSLADTHTATNHPYSDYVSDGARIT